MSKERDILKSLLLKEELEVLNQLKSKLLSEDQFTQEVAKVLSNAIKRSQKEDPQLEQALKAPIRKGVLNAFKESKQSIIDALLPVMGQLIRKTVTNSIKQFVADINRTLELGFSSKALKWRWQAIKTGKSFAEIVFQKTIRYQVTDIFLINRDNGLLIEHAGSDDLLKDNNAISAMLTALQSFIGDSFTTEDANLQSVEISNQDFIIASGPKVYLAAVVKGSPTERLKQKFQENIENIHANFSDTLLDEKTYQNNIELNDYLRGELVTKSISDKQKDTNLLPWVIALLFLASAFFYWSYHRKQAFNEVSEKSSQIEGFYLQKVQRDGGGFKVYGLLDPLANTEVLLDKKVKFITKPYISLDTSIVKKRINQVASDYPTIRTQFENGQLHLSGNIPFVESQLLLTRLYAINGVNKIDSQLTITNKPVKEKKQDWSYVINQINHTFINIPELTNESMVREQLGIIINNLQLLQEKHVRIELNIVGKSDCSGSLSDEYSLRRANLVKKILQESLINPPTITVDIESCKNNKQEKNLSLLGVNFIIKER